MGTTAAILAFVISTGTATPTAVIPARDRATTAPIATAAARAGEAIVAPRAVRQTPPRKGWVERHPAAFMAIAGFIAGFAIGWAAGDDGVFDDFTGEFNGVLLGTMLGGGGALITWGVTR